MSPTVVGLCVAIVVIIIIYVIRSRNSSSSGGDNGGDNGGGGGGSKCSAENMCPSPQGCVNGTCGSCTGDSDCLASNLPHCATNGDCVECNVNKDCPTGQTCSGNVCISGSTACADGNDCTAPQACPAGGGTCGSCDEQSMCPESLVCDTTSGNCVECASPSDCTAPQGCVNYVCGSCTDNSQCQNDTPVCSGGSCKAACTTMTDCMNSAELELYHAGNGTMGSKACVKGVCTNCQVDKDCDDGYACTSVAFGSVCNKVVDTPNDCATGLYLYQTFPDDEGSTQNVCVACEGDGSTEWCNSNGPWYPTNGVNLYGIGGTCENSICKRCAGSEECTNKGGACLANGTCGECTTAVECMTSDQIADAEKNVYGQGVQACINNKCTSCTGTGEGQCPDGTYCNKYGLCSPACVITASSIYCQDPAATCTYDAATGIPTCIT